MNICRSLRVYLELKKGRAHPRTEKCLYLAKLLPEKVVPSASYYKIKQNQVIVTLRKEVPGCWKNTLDTYGLDISDRDA